MGEDKPIRVHGDSIPMRALRKVFPTREVFTEEEIRLAKAVAEAVHENMTHSRLPKKKYHSLYSVFMVDHVRLKVVPRGPVMAPKDACMGCYFKSGKNNPCSSICCSSFDREDKRNVWFVEV